MSNEGFPPQKTKKQADKNRALLICFSHLRWNFVFQRPQHLMTRAARTYDVLFFEEPIYRDVASPDLEITDHDGVLVAVPVLPERMNWIDPAPVLRALLREVLDRRPLATRVFWFYTPMALAFADPAEADVVVYDNMDELSAFRGAPQGLLDREAALFRAAHVVFTGGHSLYEAKRGRHPNLHAFPSSIDAAHFGRARGSLADPEGQAHIRRPRIGFFGVVDERMDRDLVGALAALKPDWQFVMIGPVVKVDPETLPRRDNIHWLGMRDYRDLPAHLAHWDAGFMPFAINEATRFISPTKTPEFLAAGLPVVSTPITDVIRPYGEKSLVSIAWTAEEMAAALGEAMARGRSAAWLEAVDAHLGRLSWDRTWAAMEAEIDKARPVVVPTPVKRPRTRLPTVPTRREGGLAHV